MKTIYVDDITKKQKNQPGPGAYELQSGFGKLGSYYTMRPKVDPFEIQLKRQKKLPGPGTYLDSYVNLAGKS